MTQRHAQNGDWEIIAAGPYPGAAPRPGTVLHAAMITIAAGNATMGTIQAAIDAVGLHGSHPAMRLLKWAAANRGINFRCVDGIVTASGCDAVVVESASRTVASGPMKYYEGKQDKEQQENRVSTLTVPAARVKQGTLTLYGTSMKVRDLIAPGVYSVETLDPDNLDDKGYQRLLNQARAKKLADYVLKGQDSGDVFLPTSVFLATARIIPFDATHNTITFDTAAIGAFSVVDGQHRLEGLRLAAAKDPRVLDFEVSVNIAVGLSKIAQMCHFLIVNTTQKSVDKSVEQRIIARLTDALDLEDVPSLPKWIQNTVQRGEVDRALRFVDYLNTVEDSPWRGRIKMANDDIGGSVINQKSFVKAIVKYVLTANNPLAAFGDAEREKKVFLNYWKSIAELLDDGNAAVLYKYNGVELFCKFSIPFFMKLMDKKSFTVATMKALLQHSFDNVDGDYAAVGHPDWWASGSKASFLNAGALNVVSQDLAKALNKAEMSTDFEI